MVLFGTFIVNGDFGGGGLCSKLTIETLEQGVKLLTLSKLMPTGLTPFVSQLFLKNKTRQGPFSFHSRKLYAQYLK